MEIQNDELQLDLVELFHYLKKRILVIVVVFVLCACVGFGVTKFVMDPEYTASTRMYVLNRSSETNVVYSDFQTSTQLLNDYKVLITGRNVTDEVISRLGLNMGSGTLAGMIQVTAPSGTRVLQINITDTNPQRAADIANTVREVASEQIQNLMEVDAVKDVYEAEVPLSPSGPNVMYNTAIAAAIGLAAVVVILSAIFLMDDTIRTEEDVERYLGLSVLGVIPAEEDMSVAASKRAGRGKVKKNTPADGGKK